MGAYACPEPVIPCILNQFSKTEHTCYPRRGRCPHRPAIWDVRPARSKREMSSVRKNEPPGRRPPGSMRASTPTRGVPFPFYRGGIVPGPVIPRVLNRPGKPKHPTVRIGDDAHIVPQSGMSGPPSQNGKCHRYGKTNRPVDEPTPISQIVEG